MKSKHLIYLLLLTVLLLAAFWLVVPNRNSSTDTVSAEAVELLPGIGDQIDGLARIELQWSDQSMSLLRRGDAWYSWQQHSFPIENERMRSFLLGLIEMRVVEQRTNNPKLYHRIGVGDPKQDNTNRSMSVRLVGSDDAVLAKLIIGHAGPPIGAASSGRESRYVRLADAKRSWLVEANLYTDAKPLEWLDRQIVHFREERIGRIELTGQDGEKLVVARQNWDDAAIEPDAMPDGRELRSGTVANGIAWGLEYLEFEDLAPRPADLSPFKRVARYETLDGIGVTVREAELPEKEQKWYVLDAETIDAAPALPDEAFDEKTDERKRLRRPEAIQDELQRIISLTGKWMFVLPEHKTDRYHQTLADLLKPLPDEEESTSGLGTEKQ